MGYYTMHKLEIIKGNDLNIDYEKEISEIADYSELFKNSCKWYEHEKDMREYSKKYPNTVFKLSGEREESGDLWIEYYLNGKKQRAEAIITFDDYDESKLI